MQDLHITYDEEGDILYIAFRTDRHASTLSLHDNVLLRYDPQTVEVVGLTIIGFSDLLAFERQGQPLALRNLTELPHLAQVITKLLAGIDDLLSNFPPFPKIPKTVCLSFNKDV